MQYYPVSLLNFTYLSDYSQRGVQVLHCWSFSHWLWCGGQRRSGELAVLLCKLYSDSAQSPNASLFANLLVLLLSKQGHPIPRQRCPSIWRKYHLWHGATILQQIGSTQGISKLSLGPISQLYLRLWGGWLRRCQYRKKAEIAGLAPPCSGHSLSDGKHWRVCTSFLLHT